ncbi:hypothetical protein P7C70_g3074, partial [Phenoliferia sp. Uapishka_3]
MTKALEFALFKTYGIKTISDLLLHTTEFKDPAKAGKRYVDTSLLIVAFIVFPLSGPESGAAKVDGRPVDPRSAVAVARINYLHGLWASKISNDDLLYTLSTFILEPNVWASQFEWRSLTPVEEMAWHVFFSEIGRRMGIKNIPSEISELQDWAEEYEIANMNPDETCAQVASATTRLLLHNVPFFARGFGEKIVACLLYDRLRESIMVRAPPALLRIIVRSALCIRGFIIRNFFLPRRESDKVSIFPLDAPAFPEGFTTAPATASYGSTEEKMYAPKMAPQFYFNEPWYMPVKGGLSGAVNSTLLFLGIVRPDQVPGPDYKPEGLRLEDCGPKNAEGKGAAAIKKMAEELQGAPLEGPYALGGCPAMRCPFSK